MEQKYELIKGTYSLYRVKALKDFTLITGETIKKGDFGGFVKSEDCLGQEGNCWIMDDAYVEGEVSGNAVVKDFAIVNGHVSENAVVKDHAAVYGDVFGDPIIKDYAKIYGSVSGNAIIKDFAKVYGDVCGNAIVKDDGFVGTNTIVTGNTVVQAFQRINYGTVTTDLLGTKDWAGALYAEFGVFPKDGKVTLYKNVRSTDNPNVFGSVYNRKFIYEIGKEAIETDVDEDIIKWRGKGLHFTSLKFIDPWEGNTILECEVDLKDIITIQYSVVRTRKCKVIRVYKEE